MGRIELREMGAHPLGWQGHWRWQARPIGPHAGEGQLGRQWVSAHKARKNRKSFFLFKFVFINCKLI
jgi:hypothetical protein